MADGRVLVALDDGPLVAAPVWTRIDNLDGCRCNGIDINRGRQSELDLTGTGTARVYFNDTAGLLDPNNVASPYFGKLDGAQIMLQLFNPVTSAWVPQYRGFVDEPSFEIDPSGVKSNVQLECVDMFDFLAGVEMVIGTFGDVVPAGSEGTIFYEDGPVDGRIIALLTDAGLSAALWAVFSGNVNVLETKYDPGDSVLVAIRDAADAEFPGIANIYVDKGGKVQFHGRFARFDPDTVSASAAGWDFHRWKAGDAAAIALDAARAQVRPPFRYARPRSRIINSYVAWPRGIAETGLAAQRKSDAVSIAAYGLRGRSAPDLIVKGHKTNGNTGAQECQLFADFYVKNYKDPKNNLESVAFRSLNPTDPRAAATWALIAGVDISDILNLSVTYPGGTGIVNTDFYVEGLAVTIRPLNQAFDMVELVPNLSPFAYYTDNVFS